MLNHLPQHFFSGSNTRTGFFGCFDELFNPNIYRKLYILKGGAGTGKSTLMKRVGTYALERGLNPVYCHCASDPNSLDGVIVPSLGFAVTDGTAPHMSDPRYPVSVDETIDLAVMLNPRVMTAFTNSLKELNELTAARFLMAHNFTAAATNVANAINCTYRADKCGVWKKLNSLMCFEQTRCGGMCTNLFLRAHTPEGIIGGLTANDGDGINTVTVNAPAFFDMTEYYDTITRTASALGCLVYICRYPTDAKRIESVIIVSGDKTTHITTDNDTTKEPIIDLTPDIRAMCDSTAYVSRYYDLLSISTLLLREARAIHAETEAVSLKAADFSYVDKVYKRITDMIDELTR